MASVGLQPGVDQGIEGGDAGCGEQQKDGPVAGSGGHSRRRCGQGRQKDEQRGARPAKKGESHRRDGGVHRPPDDEISGPQEDGKSQQEIRITVELHGNVLDLFASQCSQRTGQSQYPSETGFLSGASQGDSGRVEAHLHNPPAGISSLRGAAHNERSGEVTMAEIIDIRGRFRRGVLAGSPGKEDGGALFRLRLGGPDLHWVGLVGSVLAGALAMEGFHTVFEELATPAGIPPVLGLRSGRRSVVEMDSDPPPGLVVAGNGLCTTVLRGCDCRTVLLLPVGGERRIAFVGREVPLPVADPAAESLEIAVACAGGAACLLGVIGIGALEQALCAELTMAAGLDRHLDTAVAAYDRLAPWAGVVPELPAG